MEQVRQRRYLAAGPGSLVPRRISTAGGSSRHARSSAGGGSRSGRCAWPRCACCVTLPSWWPG